MRLLCTTPIQSAAIPQGAFTTVNHITVIETVMKITPTINNYTVNTFECIDDDNTAPYERWYAQQVMTKHGYTKLQVDFMNNFQLEKLDTFDVHLNNNTCSRLNNMKI